MPTFNQLKFQDATSFVMTEFDKFHKYIMMFLLFMTILTLYFVLMMILNTPSFRNFTENQQMELWWTISPAFILMALAIPSVNLLYKMDEKNNPTITVKTMGHQWYWSYEMWDNNLMEFDSYMINLEDYSQTGLPRLLEVDNRLMLPINKDIRFITSSTDVIHAWSLPNLGLKMDAVPGRLNQMFIKMNRPGVFYGQCSEMCGANHSFMPIVIEATKQKFFHNWCSIIE